MAETGNTFEPDAHDASQEPRSSRKRHGDAPIVLVFVVGLAGVIIGAASQSRALAIAGAILVALGVFLLIRPSIASDTSASVWECDECGWVFEMQVNHHKSSITLECPHCHKESVCNRVDRK